MNSLPHLHWSTLGAPPSGLERSWAAVWQVTVDRSAVPALPPPDTDLWVISAAGPDPGPALPRLCAEVGALPILVLLDPQAPAPDSAGLARWGALGSIRWGLAGEEPPLPGLRPAPPPQVPLSISQALGLGLVGMGPAMQQVLATARAASATRATEPERLKKLTTSGKNRTAR